MNCWISGVRAWRQGSRVSYRYVSSHRARQSFDSDLQLSPIVGCISIVRQLPLTTLSLKRLRKSLSLILVTVCNGVTCMPSQCKNLLAFCTGPQTNMEVRQKVWTSFCFLKPSESWLSVTFIGLGLHLKELAQKLPPHHDLHEPGRLLSDLSEYEHLHRVFRLCHVHVFHNIKDINVAENVKHKMRSLVCVEHEDFDGALRDIEREGGKVGSGECESSPPLFSCNSILLDWVKDKIRSKFALEGICWERSSIPKLIWQISDSTSNAIESLHSDVNSEGVCCSLLGGVHKGHHFDNLKLKTLNVVFFRAT